MPYIEIKTTKKVADEKAEIIKCAMGKAIECFPGKTEQWLMVAVNDGLRMWMAGDDSDDSALVDVCLLGSVDKAGSEKMTVMICDVLKKELEIAPERIYVKYSGYENWGWNNMNF